MQLTQHEQSLVTAPLVDLDFFWTQHCACASWFARKLQGSFCPANVEGVSSCSRVLLRGSEETTVCVEGFNKKHVISTNKNGVQNQQNFGSSCLVEFSVGDELFLLAGVAFAGISKYIHSHEFLSNGSLQPAVSWKTWQAIKNPATLDQPTIIAEVSF